MVDSNGTVVKAVDIMAFRWAAAVTRLICSNRRIVYVTELLSQLFSTTFYNFLELSRTSENSAVTMIEAV